MRRRPWIARKGQNCVPPRKKPKTIPRRRETSRKHPSVSFAQALRDTSPSSVLRTRGGGGPFLLRDLLRSCAGGDAFGRRFLHGAAFVVAGHAAGMVAAIAGGVMPGRFAKIDNVGAGEQAQ